MRTIPKFILFLLIITILFISCSKNGSKPDKDEIKPPVYFWDLIWSDEFSADGMPDTNLWKYLSGPNWYNEELQYYT